MRKEISAGIIVYRMAENKPRFLLLYHGGKYWNFPKGHIEPLSSFEGQVASQKENDIQTAFRETEEETGLKKKDIFIRRGFRASQRYCFKKGTEQICKTVVYFLGETKKTQISVSDEHEGYGWFAYNEALAILTRHKNNQQMIRRVRAFIQGPKQRHPTDITSGKK
jgi:8-oxo-dGTP pyrophosphatase MutT (NUDIX family)